MDPPLAHALQITAWVRELERNALKGGANQAFAIGRSLYGPSLSLKALSGGYPNELDAAAMEELESDATPHAEALADKIEDTVPPRRG